MRYDIWVDGYGVFGFRLTWEQTLERIGLMRDELPPPPGRIRVVRS